MSRGDRTEGRTATCALRNDLEVLPLDRDFPALSRIPPLRQRAR